MHTQAPAHTTHNSQLIISRDFLWRIIAASGAENMAGLLLWKKPCLKTLHTPCNCAHAAICTFSALENGKTETG